MKERKTLRRLDAWDGRGNLDNLERCCSAAAAAGSALARSRSRIQACARSRTVLMRQVPRTAGVPLRTRGHTYISRGKIFIFACIYLFSHLLKKHQYVRYYI